MVFSLKDIAKLYGTSKGTVENHVKILIKKKQFKKTSIGKYYNEVDLKKLSELLGFNLNGTFNK
jgi:hypothetical protein